jgi:hypothetical protein
VPRVGLDNDRFAANDIITIDASGWSISKPEQVVQKASLQGVKAGLAKSLSRINVPP